jgi:ubiquinone/menaquinone biosynthesis C-methylase UbiE
MANNRPFDERLRSEYDAELLDADLRRKNAGRLYRALKLSGLWQKNIRLLDVGSGTGLLLSALGTDVTLRVACDLRRNLFLSVSNQVKNVHFAQADGCALPFPDNHFEMVTCLAVIEEISDWPSVLREMGRCVISGGILYVTIVNGRFLSRLYALAGKLGFRIRKDWWAYAAKAKLTLAGLNPEDGMGGLNMNYWRFVDVTPYLIQSHWAWSKCIPLSVLQRMMRYIAPSYGYAWQKIKS